MPFCRTMSGSDSDDDGLSNSLRKLKVTPPPKKKGSSERVVKTEASPDTYNEKGQRVRVVTKIIDEYCTKVLKSGEREGEKCGTPLKSGKCRVPAHNK